MVAVGLGSGRTAACGRAVVTGKPDGSRADARGKETARKTNKTQWKDQRQESVVVAKLNAGDVGQSQAADRCDSHATPHPLTPPSLSELITTANTYRQRQLHGQVPDDRVVVAQATADLGQRRRRRKGCAR